MATAEALLTAEEYRLLPDNGQATEMVCGRAEPVNMPPPSHEEAAGKAQGTIVVDPYLIDLIESEGLWAPLSYRERVRCLVRVQEELGDLAKDISELNAADPDNIRMVAQLDHRSVDLIMGDGNFGAFHRASRGYRYSTRPLISSPSIRAQTRRQADTSPGSPLST